MSRGRAAADRLQSQRPGAGEQIDGVFAAHRRSYEIKHRLAQPIFHRPGARVSGVRQLPPAMRAADNPQRRFRSIFRGRRWFLPSGAQIHILPCSVLLI